MAERIRYQKIGGYQLVATYVIQTAIRPKADIITEYIKLNRDGMLAIMRGFAWDGPSGPTKDTRSFMRGPLVHDALYRLCRMQLLDPEQHRQAADQLMWDCIVEDIEVNYPTDDLPWYKLALVKPQREFLLFRAKKWYEMVRLAAAGATDPKNNEPVLEAP